MQFKTDKGTSEGVIEGMKGEPKSMYSVCSNSHSMPYGAGKEEIYISSSGGPVYGIISNKLKPTNQIVEKYFYSSGPKPGKTDIVKRKVRLFEYDESAKMTHMVIIYNHETISTEYNFNINEAFSEICPVLNSDGYRYIGIIKVTPDLFIEQDHLFIYGGRSDQCKAFINTVLKIQMSN